MLRAVIIIIAFFGFLEARAQQGPMCQPMPTVGGPKLPRVPGQPPTADCAQWRCMQSGKMPDDSVAKSRDNYLSSRLHS
jgi:hypothetical protein